MYKDLYTGIVPGYSEGEGKVICSDSTQPPARG